MRRKYWLWWSIRCQYGQSSTSKLQRQFLGLQKGLKATTYKQCSLSLACQTLLTATGFFPAVWAKTCHHVWSLFSIAGYLAHLNTNQSCTPLRWEVWSLSHGFWCLMRNNFSLVPATLPSSGKRASANCLHLLERDLSFMASTTSLFLQVSGKTMPLSLSSFSHGLTLVHQGSGNDFLDFSVTSGLLSVQEDDF